MSTKGPGGKEPHIHLSKDQAPRRVIVCGDPARAERIAKEFLEGGKSVAKNREYHSFVGQFAGQEIWVLSHGVGAPGAMIAFQELANCGAERIIRVGTGGGLYEGFKIGDLLVAQAAVRQDGTTAAMYPIEIPAVSDLELTLAMRDHCVKQGWRHRVGTTVTSDLFYPGNLDPKLKAYQKAGVEGVEMECSALFMLAKHRGFQAGGIMALDGNPLAWDDGEYDPTGEVMKDATDHAIAAALHGLTS